MTERDALDRHLESFHFGHLSDFCATCQRLLAARSAPPKPDESLAHWIPGFDLHTDLPRVLSAIDHLLSVHNCDHMGYEEVMGSRDRLREWIA